MAMVTKSNKGSAVKGERSRYLSRTQEIRRQHFKRLVRKYASHADFAEASDISSASTISRMLSDPKSEGHKVIGEEVARRAEEKLVLPRGYLDFEIHDPTDFQTKIGGQLGKDFPGELPRGGWPFRFEKTLFSELDKRIKARIEAELYRLVIEAADEGRDGGTARDASSF